MAIKPREWQQRNENKKGQVKKAFGRFFCFYIYEKGSLSIPKNRDKKDDEIIFLAQGKLFKNFQINLRKLLLRFERMKKPFAMMIFSLLVQYRNSHNLTKLYLNNFLFLSSSYMKKDFTHKSYTVKEATLKLMRFCAYRDRSHKEVEEKLKEMRMIPAAKEQIIVELMQEDFLNEERFARSFVRGKFRIKKWGRVKIKQELKLRDISAPIIKIALTEIEEETYQNTLHELAQKKLNSIKESNVFKKKKKLLNYLLQKGYESNLVYQFTTELKEN